ncbi:unnamed protein product [Scytosiphon promiscuus]
MFVARNLIALYRPVEQCNISVDVPRAPKHEERDEQALSPGRVSGGRDGHIHRNALHASPVSPMATKIRRVSPHAVPIHSSRPTLDCVARKRQSARGAPRPAMTY